MEYSLRPAAEVRLRVPLPPARRRAGSLRERSSGEILGQLPSNAASEPPAGRALGTALLQSVLPRLAGEGRLRSR